MIIFGWGRKTNTNFGPTLPLKCSHCNNNSYWNLYRSRTWFTLFFVPVIPYDNKHVLLCQVCSRGVVLPNANVTKAKELAGHTTRYINKEISQEEYNTYIDQSNILN
jgi:hypothetical protein